jgi:hypothetical protein
MIEESPEKPLFNSHFVASARYNGEVAKERRDYIGDRRWPLTPQVLASRLFTESSAPLFSMKT